MSAPRRGARATAATRERLFALEQFGIKLGLDNIRDTRSPRSAIPDRAYPTIHVAGTNGKGSVTAMVERALRAAGHRTGRYTSPHLSGIEERIAIDGQPVDAETFRAGRRVTSWTWSTRCAATARCEPRRRFSRSRRPWRSRSSAAPASTWR